MKNILLSILLCILFTNVNNITLMNNEIKQNNDTEVNQKIKNREKKYSEYLDNTYLTNDATYYYYNLTANYPKNYKGTCTYVAMAMLLQFYDTFWDDNIIPPAYDLAPTNTISINERTSSPGVKADKISGYTDDEATEISNEDYYDYMMSMSSTYFQPYLFKIADDDFNYLTINDEDSFAALTATGRETFLNHYLQNYIGYSSTDYTLTVYNNDMDYTKSDEVKQYIINKVIQGIPVLACMKWGSYSHACIIYDYDSSTNQLFLHYGDYEGNVHTSAVNGVNTYYMSATTLEIHKAHSHSNNYGLVTNGNVTYHCGCELSTHKHSYTASYAQYSDTYHTEYCHCGAYRNNYHTCEGFDRYEPCIYCGTIVDLWTTGTINILNIPSKEENETE